MRLEKIKLSGFKSFVDPTTIALPVNLVGVVGPNGCGKSNIIDAVRWVMGESSAKNLRGGSMADVIFNGSSSRKPVGMASVELVFDNSDGTAGAAYAEYSQLSIKRQVTRDGQSTFHLNGSRCRRKDITDIFLGTGLGPRSYAIIEQGMISRLIEAKPEDLRVFLEEAAGVSKYKERRHETELRMRHTRENLDRLNDLREELSQQIERLKRQARTAERYKKLKEKERQFKRQLLALRWKNFDETCQQQQLATMQKESELEKNISAQRHQDRVIDERRDQYKDRQKEVDQIQARYYELGGVIAKIEQNIRHAKSLREQAENELQRASEEQSHHLMVLEQDKLQCIRFKEEQAQIEISLKQALSEDEVTTLSQTAVSSQLQEWQVAWDEFTSKGAGHNEQLKVQNDRIRHLGEQRQLLESRSLRLNKERERLSEDSKHATLKRLQSSVSLLEQQTTELQEKLGKLDKDVEAARPFHREQTMNIDLERTKLQSIRGRIVSLERILEHASGRDRTELTKWLATQGLKGAPRLIGQIEVESGWEMAVEVVLSRHLEAICVEQSQPFLDQFDALGKEGVAIFETSHPDKTAPPGEDRERLLKKIISPWPLDELLGRVYCAENQADAQRICQRLKQHESVITTEGIWMGRGWVLKRDESDARSGILKKEKELKQLHKELIQLEQVVKEREKLLQEALARLQKAEKDQASLRSQYNLSLNELSTKKSELGGMVAQQEQAVSRLRQVTEELEEVNRQNENNFQAAEMARRLVDESKEQSVALEGGREALISKRDNLRKQQDEVNQSAREAREAVHHLQARLELIRSNIGFTEKNGARTRAQLVQIEQRIAKVNRPDAESERSIAEQEVTHESSMKERLVVEESLQGARQSLSVLEDEIRKMTEARSRTESDIESSREKLERARIAQEGTIVHRKTVLEQLQETGADIATVLQELPEEAADEAWQETLITLAGKIERLGTINLAAIEEHETLSERMVYLGNQYEDLTDSLATLEQAISKIDKETRALFRNTFNKVNEGFQERFPKLFGGGRAYLELDDKDLLETGVTVMASPPGKRNSSIHLLSGGEKALTAVALIFSIFDLNPAPFCLLDEVDAPLDDANVGRFSELVREMSSTIQFLFISHNKTTMEIAHHLAGVTMSEPGVSRMVAVDIDEAVSLVAV